MRHTFNYTARCLVLLMLLTAGFVLLSITPSAAAEQPVLTFVYWEKAEPICWSENGVPKGLQIEIVQYIMDRLGIRVVHEFYPWKRSQLMIKNGDADCMVTTPNDERFGYSAFGKESVLPNRWTIWVKKDNAALIEKVKKFTSLDDMKPYHLADFLGNGWQSAYMKVEDGYTISFVERLEQLPKVIAIGRYDMMINSSCWIRYWAIKDGVNDQLKEISVDLPKTQFHMVMMVSRKSPWMQKGILKGMDAELKKMKASGKWDEILNKYKEFNGTGSGFTSQLDTKMYYREYDLYPEYRK